MWEAKADVEKGSFTSIEDIGFRKSGGKTLFEMAESDASLDYVCDYVSTLPDSGTA